MPISCYVLAAFEIHESKSLKYQRYRTKEGLKKGIDESIIMGADYISIRIIKVKYEVES